MPNTDLTHEARELCERATPGPWATDYNMPFSDDFVGIFVDGAGYILKAENDEEYPVRADDAEFIARARTLVPALLDELAAKDAEIARLSDCRHECKIDCLLKEYEQMKARAEKAEAERDAAVKCITDAGTYLELGSGKYAYQVIQKWRGAGEG